MSMPPQEWAARVAEIGKMAGWPRPMVLNMTRDDAGMSMLFVSAALETDPAVIAAIRQLCADWLAAEGVVANRVCRWEYQEHTCHWDGACGIAWTMIDGGLAENHVNYCPRCGGKIEVTHGL